MCKATKRISSIDGKNSFILSKILSHIRQLFGVLFLWYSMIYPIKLKPLIILTMQDYQIIKNKNKRLYLSTKSNIMRVVIQPSLPQLKPKIKVRLQSMKSPSVPSYRSDFQLPLETLRKKIKLMTRNRWKNRDELTAISELRIGFFYLP
jgi:hypothetical protein